MYKNKNIFKDLQDVETLYFLGLIATNGVITKDHKGCPSNLRLELPITDSHILEKLRDLFDTENPIKSIKEKGGLVFAQGGKNCFIPRLLRLGITPQKRFTLKVHSSLSQSLDFWRGAIDGSGSIYYRSKKHLNKKGELKTYIYSGFSFYSGSLQFMNQFTHYLKEALDVDLNISNNRNIYVTHSTRQSIVQKIIDHFYYDDCICLARNNAQN